MTHTERCVHLYALCGLRDLSGETFLRRLGPLPSLHLAEVIADPNSETDHLIGPVLIHRIRAVSPRKARHLAEVKLGAKEEMILNVELHADSHVHLEMARAAGGDCLRLANRATDAGARCVGSAKMGAADSALDPQLHVLAIYGRVQSVEIVKEFPRLNRAVVALRRLKVEFATEADVLVQHGVTLEAHEQAAQSRRGLAGSITR